MHDCPLTIPLSTPYREIVEQLHRHGQPAAPVVDPAGRVHGVVSVSDLLRHPERQAAADLMTCPAVCTTPDTIATQAARQITQADVEQLPVVDDERRAVGLVTRLDLLLMFLDTDEQLGERIEEDVVTRQFSLETGSIEVHVQGGVVTLHGELESDSLRDSLLGAVHSVPGVVAVEDHLTARPGHLPRPIIPFTRAT